jgi:ATP-dependent DNA helicase RecQ
VDAKHLYLSHDNYKLLKGRAEDKLNSVVEYVSHQNECRSRILLKYFDEKNVDECGYCDYCLRKKAIRKNPAADSLKTQIINLLSSRKIHLEELTSLLYQFESETVIDTINELADDRVIGIDNDKNIFKIL